MEEVEGTRAGGRLELQASFFSLLLFSSSFSLSSFPRLSFSLLEFSLTFSPFSLQTPEHLLQRTWRKSSIYIKQRYLGFFDRFFLKPIPTCLALSLTPSFSWLMKVLPCFPGKLRGALAGLPSCSWSRNKAIWCGVSKPGSMSAFGRGKGTPGWQPPPRPLVGWSLQLPWPRTLQRGRCRRGYFWKTIVRILTVQYKKEGDISRLKKNYINLFDASRRTPW